MQHVLYRWRGFGAVLAIAFFAALLTLPQAALAGTTGTIQGTVTASTSGAPIAGVVVTVSAATQTAKTTSDARGFYVLNGLTPDTYTISFQLEGYSPVSQPGVTVTQDQAVSLNVALTKELKVIATV
nr:carboxypeptidase-like regulatory domain-containing protein [Candidatus Eremiobacteraeota bacterium]